LLPLALTVAAGALGVGKAASATLLITPAGMPYRIGASGL
jgi:hypothetical protein